MALVGQTFGPSNGNTDPSKPQGGSPNPVADAIRILSLQMPQNVGAGSPTPLLGDGGMTPMGGQFQSGLLMQWLRNMLGGQQPNPGGVLPPGMGTPWAPGMPGNGPGGGGGRFGFGNPGGGGVLPPSFNFIHGTNGPRGNFGNDGRAIPMPGNLGNDGRAIPVGGSFMGDLPTPQLGTGPAPSQQGGDIPLGGGPTGIGQGQPNTKPGMEDTFVARRA